GANRSTGAAGRGRGLRERRLACATGYRPACFEDPRSLPERLRDIDLAGATEVAKALPAGPFVISVAPMIDASLRGTIRTCRVTLHGKLAPRPAASMPTPADRRALTLALPPTPEADARAIASFIDAIWAESGLARQSLDSYRRDLEGFARWRNGA